MQQNARAHAGAGQRNLNAKQAEHRKSTSRQNVLASLRATSIVASKPALPAELLAAVLNHLPPSDLLRCARVSRRLQEMVYDDTRWVQKLKAMGVWKDLEAKSQNEDGLQKRFSAGQGRDQAQDQARQGSDNLNGQFNGVAKGHARNSSVFFDAGVEERREQQRSKESTIKPRRATLTDGFDDLTISSSQTSGSHTADTSIALHIFENVSSVRRRARKEYGRIYSALNPFYVDATKSTTSTDPLIFRVYTAPEQQASMLANLLVFARSDTSSQHEARAEKLQEVLSEFQDTAMRQFRHGYELEDTDIMRRYAQVSITLNGGAAAVDTFISNNPLITGIQKLANPLDCVDGVAYGHVDLSPSHRFFERMANVFAEQAALIDRVFPPNIDVLLPLLLKMSESAIQPFITTLFDATYAKGNETFLKAVPAVFEHCMRFLISLHPTKASQADFKQQAKELLLKCFEPHVDRYLKEELDQFRNKSEGEVTLWEKDLSDQEAQAESFFMSNVNRQAVKRDFLSSFKKVVMMPVNALPAFPLAANRQSTISASESIPEKSSSRSNTPSLAQTGFPARPSTPPVEAPTTELAAKTAIMNSRLEGIKSLFSIEVAINLIHHAKSSIERCAILIRHSDHFALKTKTQCEKIFITLVQILGQRHIKSGFDRALEHLAHYNPREVKELRSKAVESGQAAGVEPLVTFCELVNVGDLIQQMVDVFYVQELVSTKLTDRDDFLNPAGKEKKQFEQMLDERVAAGLGKGIDVLMDEVEYICATTQLATDFNPDAVGKGSMAGGLVDIGPSITAKLVVDTIGGHTGMLVGSTEKHMLDVFNQEVGLRLFGALCKHIKRQRISVDGAIKLISDINHYSAFISTLRQKPLVPYYAALRELSQIYLIDCDMPLTSPTSPIAVKAAKNKKGNTSAHPSAKELATIIADTDRYKGIFPAEEVYEFAERRADWFAVKRDVERNMYGFGCVAM